MNTTFEEKPESRITKTFEFIPGNKVGITICEFLGINPGRCTGLFISVLPGEIVTISAEIAAPYELDGVDWTELGTPKETENE